MHVIAMISLSDLWWWISVIVKVSIGLGAVIFVHELGHYLVARLCGVKIEKFMIGFDIGGYKLSWRRGETIYGIGILPIGGYVKMLGQDDDPAHIAEQMKKSELDPKSAHAKPITGPDGETYYVDRRSYLAKSVPQRMAIISAGVVMNVIFAFIFAVIAYGMGVPYIPSVVSETVPGSPAWQAGIEPGDEIVRIGNRREPTFIQLKGGVTLGDLEHGVDCEVRRAADGKVENITLMPQQSGGGLATIGLLAPFSLNLVDPAAIKWSPASRATLVQPAASDKPDEAKFKDGDIVVRVGGTPVQDYRTFTEQLAKQPERPLQVTVHRPAQDGNPTAVPAVETKPETQKESDAKELTFEVPPQHLQRFPFVMKIGPITSVRKGSPAAAAGLAPGDVIEQVDGKKLGESGTPNETWDGETLPDYLRRAAEAGRTVELTVLRSNRDASEQLKVQMKPQPATMMSIVVPPRSSGTPMAANEVGIAYRIKNEIAFVTPDSPAAAEDLWQGDKLLQAKVILPEGDVDAKAEPIIVKFVRDKPGWFGRLLQKIFGTTPAERELHDWPRLTDIVQFLPEGSQVEFTVQHGDDEPRKVKIAPTAAQDAYIAARGFWFKPIERTRKAETFAEQVRYGWDETTEALTMVFSFLKKLGTQVPISALGGPVSIAKAAGYSAAEGMSTLLMFLTMLSANLAVLNFLPIPLLDGGHLVFLAYEGIRGRPANEKFVVALHTVGFVFIVSLMLYVLALDLNIIPRSL